MMTRERDEKFGAYCGVAGVILFGPAPIAAGFLPLPSPSLAPDEVVRFSVSNEARA